MNAALAQSRPCQRCGKPNSAMVRRCQGCGATLPPGVAAESAMPQKPAAARAEGEAPPPRTLRLPAPQSAVTPSPAPPPHKPPPRPIGRLRRRRSALVAAFVAGGLGMTLAFLWLASSRPRPRHCDDALATRIAGAVLRVDAVRAKSSDRRPRHATGFFVSSDGFFVTARRLFAAEEGASDTDWRVSVTLADGTRVRQVQCIAEESVSGLALLRIERRPTLALPLSTMDDVTAADSAIGADRADGPGLRLSPVELEPVAGSTGLGGVLQLAAPSERVGLGAPVLAAAEVIGVAVDAAGDANHARVASVRALRRLLFAGHSRPGRPCGVN